MKIIPKQLQTPSRKGFLRTKKLQKAPYGFWRQKQHQKEFFDWLGGQLGYKSMDDWYNLKREDILKNGGGKILSRYRNYLKSLQTIYPEHNWMLWRFKRVPIGYWTQLLSNQQETTKLINWLGVQLCIKCLDDWY